MMEKEEKRHLEQRINSMQSQLLIGGHKVEDMPAFRSLLKKEQRRIRSEYEERLRELEKERQNVEQDKAQVPMSPPSRSFRPALLDVMPLWSLLPASHHSSFPWILYYAEWSGSTLIQMLLISIVDCCFSPVHGVWCRWIVTSTSCSSSGTS